MTTIDEALAHGGPLLVAWDDSTTPETLFVYALDDGRPTRLAFERAPSRDKAALNASLRERGVPVARAHGSEHLWTEPGPFLAWSSAGLIAEGHDLGLKVAGGRMVRKGDVAQVTSFLDDDSLGHRGVRVDLKDGSSVVVVEEHDSAADQDPTYGMDNVAIDAAWATFLGRALAAWLGVPHTDQLP